MTDHILFDLKYDAFMGILSLRGNMISHCQLSPRHLYYCESMTIPTCPDVLILKPNADPLGMPYRSLWLHRSRPGVPPFPPLSAHALLTGPGFTGTDLECLELKLGPPGSPPHSAKLLEGPWACRWAGFLLRPYLYVKNTIIGHTQANPIK